MSALPGGRAAVLGWARSGRSAARLLKAHGVSVFVSDRRTAEQLDPAALEELTHSGFAYELGGHTKTVLEQDFVVLSPGIPPEIPILAEASEEIPILSEIEVASRVLKAELIAVTGTNGKTTTCTALAQLLSEAGRTAHLLGNVGTPLSDVALTAEEDEIVVCEVSSFQLETIEEFRPAISVLINLKPDHLDRYPDFESYRRAKERLFLNQTEEEIAVVNLDDPVSAEIAETLLPRVAGVSMERELEDGVFLRGRSVISTTTGRERVLISEIQNAPAEFKAVENLLIVCAVADLLGVKPERIKSSVLSFKGLRHRLELVGELNGLKFYNDSKATNVAAVDSALRNLAPPIVLLMGGKDKGEDYTALTELIRTNVVQLKLFGHAGRRIHDALGGVVPTTLHGTLDEAVIAAFNDAQSNTAVLLSPACSSYDAFENFEERGDHFARLVKDEIAKRS